MYGYLSDEERQKNVNAFVALAASAVLGEPLNKQLERFKKNIFLLKLTNVMLSMKSSLFIGGGWLGMRVCQHNVENVDHQVVKKMCLRAIEDIAPGVLNQFYLFVKNGAFVSADAGRNYADDLDRIHVPVLLIAGEKDSLVPHHSMRSTHEKLASEDKTFTLFGTAGGYEIDYGHADLILGKHAPNEVYPLILKWLDEHPMGKRENE